MPAKLVHSIRPAMPHLLPMHLFFIFFGGGSPLGATLVTMCNAEKAYASEKSLRQFLNT